MFSIDVTFVVKPVDLDARPSSSCHNMGFREKDLELKTFHSIEPIAARMSFHGKVHLVKNTEIRSKDLVPQRPSYSLTVTIRPSDHEMDRLCVALITFLCAVSSSQDGISAVEVELRVRPGDNITLYCDCIITTGVHIMWNRNCSHRYQPPLVISIYNVYQNLQEMSDNSNRFPGYNVLWNPSNNSYDLLIENITESDLGLYYCGTVENQVVDDGGKGGIEQKELYHYGNITTRISLETSPPESSSSSPPPVDCGLCWMLLFSLCPVSALLSSLLSSTCVYSFCRTTAPTETQVPLNRTTTRGSDSREQTTVREEGDLCYASLDIRQGQRRPKKKKRTKNSDFSTYSDINTSRV
ncbi:uncharacterized protein LOC116360163 [Oncorhynchus kisutch]|uniref:uncharacterized protein LOC116360163 n=1 Tax=Oncorhynchus kisutch TaxID=8019 RepID=UPI0012DBF7CD|nr:uncharacterized protein LOC116360163 [Oncorhynchus kisutch]